MKYKVTENKEIDFGDMGQSFFLIGLLNEFMNQFQAAGDRFFEEISWKQCFVLICTNFFSEPPTLRELSELMGSSHQNVKQMLLKLEKLGYVEFVPDEQDKRKQRIVTTDKTRRFNQEHDKSSEEFMPQLFSGISEQELGVTIQTISKLDEQLKRMR